MVRAATKEHDILHDQQLDLIYSHSSTLYGIIPNDIRLSIVPRKPNLGTHVDGVVGSFSHASVNQLAYHMGQMSIKSHLSASGTNAQTNTIPNQTSKVN
jgi:hypothetical protein